MVIILHKLRRVSSTTTKLAIVRMCPVLYSSTQYVKPWPHSDIRSCCHQPLHALNFTFMYDSTLLGHTFLHQRYFCMRFAYMHMQLL